jgi:hypothetical protein
LYRCCYSALTLEYPPRINSTGSMYPISTLHATPPAANGCHKYGAPSRCTAVRHGTGIVPVSCYAQRAGASHSAVAGHAPERGTATSAPPRNVAAAAAKGTAPEPDSKGEQPARKPALNKHEQTFWERVPILQRFVAHHQRLPTSKESWEGQHSRAKMMSISAPPGVDWPFLVHSSGLGGAGP